MCISNSVRSEPNDIDMSEVLPPLDKALLMGGPALHYVITQLITQVHILIFVPFLMGAISYLISNHFQCLILIFIFFAFY